MKKKCFYLFVLVLFCSFNIHVLAEDIASCNKDELSRIKEIAEKVEINYEYELKEVNKNGKIVRYPIYSLVATNLNPDIKVLIINDYLSGDYKEFKYNDTKIASINGFLEGEKVTVTIKAYTSNKCSGRTLLSKTISFPYYNGFSEERLCELYPEFKYCSLLLDKKIDYDIFNDELDKYIEANKTQEIEEQNENDWTLLIVIVIVIVVMALLLIIVMIIMKVRRKNAL